MYFEVYKDAKGEFRWRLVARNKKIIADSGEGYKTASGCERAIIRVIKIISTPRVIVRL